MIEEWAEINKIASETSNYSLAKEYDCLWILKLLLVIYIIVSALALWLVCKNYFNTSMVMMAVTIFIMQYITNIIFLKKYDDRLKGLSRAKKHRYFKYLRFKEAFTSSSILAFEKIDSLLAWQEIEELKAEKTNFFETKLFITPITGLFGLVLGYFATKDLHFREFSLLLIIFIVFLFVAWNIFDLFTVGKKRQVEIKRSLRWLVLDQDKEIGDGRHF